MKEYLCPHCRNPIYDEEALLCHFCGESLRRSSPGLMGKLRSGRWIAALIALLVVVSFLVLVMR